MKTFYQKLCDSLMFFKTNKTEDNSNYILFELLDDSDVPNVKIKIANTSQESAEKFADMLYDINRGLYNQSIIDLLLSIGKEDNTISQYVQSIILWWKLLVTKTTNSTFSDNHPLIKPTDFNKYVNKQ